MEESYIELARLFNASPKWEPIINYESNKFFAILLLASTLALIYAASLSNKSGLCGSVKFIILSVFASLTFGFGSVFLSDYIGVYV